ncbi:hypothetical protein FIBSPDRAFT_941054 [Athelia psychrophila]|uniref:Uncharacterized protein n=1 Tax=Athelia psychrophila TaxID=1759441 RepID=A0A167UV56_9AGAM|nr:hypothetical protein FIBSPDRAFT_941054 [Fibularhizoctonia sp. CBS 109695]
MYEATHRSLVTWFPTELTAASFNVAYSARLPDIARFWMSARYPTDKVQETLDVERPRFAARCYFLHRQALTSVVHTSLVSRLQGPL